MDHIGQKLNLEDPRLRNRILSIGVIRLMEGANSASAYYSRGGPKVWADGMMKEINHGLRNKFELYVNNEE